MALNNINHVNGRFISNANRFWWAYQIAVEFNVTPKEVKRWDSDDIMEALAAIKLMEPKEKGGN